MMELTEFLAITRELKHQRIKNPTKILFDVVKRAKIYPYIFHVTNKENLKYNKMETDKLESRVIDLPHNLKKLVMKICFESMTYPSTLTYLEIDIWNNYNISNSTCFSTLKKLQTLKLTVCKEQYKMPDLADLKSLELIEVMTYLNMRFDIQLLPNTIKQIHLKTSENSKFYFGDCKDNTIDFAEVEEISISSCLTTNIIEFINNFLNICTLEVSVNSLKLVDLECFTKLETLKGSMTKCIVKLPPSVTKIIYPAEEIIEILPLLDIKQFSNISSVLNYRSKLVDAKYFPNSIKELSLLGMTHYLYPFEQEYPIKIISFPLSLEILDLSNVEIGFVEPGLLTPLTNLKQVSFEYYYTFPFIKDSLPDHHYKIVFGNDEEFEKIIRKDVYEATNILNTIKCYNYWKNPNAKSFGY